MFRRLIPMPAVLAITVFAVLAGAGQPARADPAALDRWFEATRVQDSLRGFPKALMEGLDESGSLTGDIGRDDVAALAERHFAAGVLADDLRRVMPETLKTATSQVPHEPSVKMAVSTPTFFSLAGQN